MSIRIVVVDAHPVTRTGTIAVLGRDAGLQVVGEAEDGAEAIALCRAVEPDLVVLDVRCPPSRASRWRAPSPACRAPHVS